MANFPLYQRMAFLNNARVISTIPTDHNPLSQVACVRTDADEAWVSIGTKILMRVGIQSIGSVQEPVSFTCEQEPVDISLFGQKDLLYSEKYTVKILNYETNTSKTQFCTPEHWEARGLCCTKSEDILVSVFNTHTKENKVLRYQGEKMIQEIDKNEQGEKCFKDGIITVFLTENNNGDICVSDGNANRVVILDSSGRFRFDYDASDTNDQHLSVDRKQFCPRCICTDSLSQIIISDMDNDCLHILDKNGIFLRFVENCALNQPKGLSVDNKGRLWVGLYRTGEVKVIKYLR